MKTINIEAQADIQAAADDSGFPTVSMMAYGGGPIRVAGYKNPVVIDLDGVDGLGRSMPLLMQHNHDRIVGHGTPERDGNSLVLSGVIGADNADSQQVLTLAKSGFPWRSSVGAEVRKAEELPRGKSAVVNGQTVVGPMTIARSTYVYETSFTAVPADKSTSAVVAASFDKDKVGMEFSNWVASQGFDSDTLSDKQRGVLQAAYDAQGSDTVTQSSVDQVIEAARGKEQRQREYGRVIEAAIGNGLDSETANKLVQAAGRDNLSATEFELQVLRLQRAPSYNSQRHSGSDLSAEVIEAALVRGVGAGDVVEGQFKPEVLEASEKQFKHGLSLVELLQLSARRNGHRDISHRDLRPLLQAAFAPIQAGNGASTYDLGGVLSNVASKMIRAGFDSVEQEWRKVSSIAPVNDFKEMKSYSLTGDFIYKEVGIGGELTHATAGAEAYSNAAKTYGRMFTITRHDLINDDLGAFNRIRTLMGRGAALAFNKIFWTEFLKDVGTFYTTDRGNYFEGASSALDVDSLSTGFTTFESITDPDGNPLGLSPGVLVVPTALKIKGNQLVNDPEIRVSGASAKTTYSTSNPHAGKVELASSTYLNNANIPNGSATHWFLIADPMDMPVIETVFLYGRQNPVIDTADADFDTLGVSLRGYHDFGVNKQEYRAGVRSKGQA